MDDDVVDVDAEEPRGTLQEQLDGVQMELEEVSQHKAFFETVP